MAFVMGQDGVAALGSYEDHELAVSARLDNEGSLVLYGWSKTSREISLDTVTDRWVEARLADVKTTDELKQFQQFRRLIRGAVYEAKARQKVVDVLQVEGGEAVSTVGVETALSSQPMHYRFRSSSVVVVSQSRYLSLF